MKILLALAFLAVASALPAQDIQPIVLPAAPTPEYHDDAQLMAAPDAVKITNAAIEDASATLDNEVLPELQPVSLPEPAMPYVEVVNADDVDIASAPVDATKDLPEIQPVYLSEPALPSYEAAPVEAAEYFAVDAVKVADAGEDLRELQPVSLPEAPMPYFEESADAVRVADMAVDEQTLEFQAIDISPMIVPEEVMRQVRQFLEAPEFVNFVNGQADGYVPLEARRDSPRTAPAPAEIEDVFDALVEQVRIVDAPVAEAFADKVMVAYAPIDD